MRSRSRNRNMRNILLGQKNFRRFQRQKRYPSLSNAALMIQVKPNKNFFGIENLDDEINLNRNN